MGKILIVEDDVAFCQMLETFLRKKKHEVTVAYSGEEALRKIKANTYQIILTDVRLPEKDGNFILNEVTENYPETKVILMTGYAEVNMAVNAMKEGAVDYISKPVQPEQLLASVEKALAIKTAPKSMVKPAKSKTSSKPLTEAKYVKGVSDASKKLNNYIQLVGPTNMSVLIIGESGTGKEYVAKNIHNQSKRSKEAFIAVDCGAIPKEIASSEFFGHVKGSFTGAVNDKIGHFEAANNGTLFLDEIGNLSYELQVQLLRALQERKIKPVGSNKEVAVNIRIITATNENLKEAVEAGTFREDLYHRLNEFSIQVPSLKERNEDIMLFANFFLAKANRELEKEVVGFSDDAITLLTQYQWPGNLREMQNAIKRAVLLTTEALILPEVFPENMLSYSSDKDEKDYSLFKNKNEEEMIINALKETGGNKSKAARLLNIDRKTLYNKLKQYEIDL